jgi:hypothetical protein
LLNVAFAIATCFELHFQRYTKLKRKVLRWCWKPLTSSVLYFLKNESAGLLETCLCFMSKCISYRTGKDISHDLVHNLCVILHDTIYWLYIEATIFFIEILHILSTGNRTIGLPSLALTSICPSVRDLMPVPKQLNFFFLNPLLI